MPSRSAAVLLLLFLSPFALAQRAGLVSFRRLAIPDDVPAHLCSAIAQDARGFLWFGTQRGLVRYDGYEYRVFRSDPSDPGTLAGNYVRALLASRDGRLWVGTFSGGLSVLDPRTGTFTRFTGLSYDRVEALAEDADGRIWIGTTAGLDRLDPRTRRIEHLTQTAVRAVLIDRSGRPWIGTRDGLVRRDGAAFPRVALAGQNVTRLFEDRRGRIWIGTDEHGAAVLDPGNGALHRIAPRPIDPGGLSHYWVYGFAEAAPGEIWVATFGGGIDVLDERTLAIVDRLHHDPVLPDTIGADRVGALFRDRSGLVWVGTWGEGLAWHDPRTRAFRTLRFSPNRPDGLTHGSAVRALETRDGRIWVGTNGNGIDVLDRDLKRVGEFRPGANGLSDGAITCLAEARDGAVWVATLNAALHVLRPGAVRFERVRVVPGGAIRTIALGSDGTVWVGAAEGMARIDPRTLESRLFRTWPGAGKSSPAIEAIAVAADGKLWIGTDNGLYSFDPRTDSMVRIAKDASRPDGLPDNWVPDLMIARDGRLWAGTASGAAILTHWDGRRARFEHVSTSPAEALIEDLEGNVWIGPRVRVDPGATRTFGPADGVAFRTFFIASRARTRDGRLLFGSPEGLLVVDPRVLPPPGEAQPIVASGLRVEGKPRPVPAALTLASTERSFTIDIASLDFAAPQRLSYRHRLDPLDADWTSLGALQHSLTYSRLPPGRYTLRVGVTNRDGAWSAQELRLPVEVMPAFYQTRWFRALVVLAIAGLLYGAYRLRVRQLRARERELERLVAKRTRELETAYAKIEEVSLTDPLTGLRNRRYLEQTIDADLGSDLVILMADLDHFKSVNDRYGHAAGDAVLVELAHLLQQTFRTSDHVVRWGGEEFLIVARTVDGSQAAELAEKLRVAVAEHPFVLPDGTVLQRTCSIGVAVWPLSPAVKWERAVDLADGALYEAKRAGRNRWATAF
ncbi:MAG TPA: two-component regulator propeller domain-containing protein [Thermoanaerobaculia bacterium]|nr:two-component regulator propeller domain-containing protein [Thermoanaerobaculia bacterium]